MAKQSDFGTGVPGSIPSPAFYIYIYIYIKCARVTKYIWPHVGPNVLSDQIYQRERSNGIFTSYLLELSSNMDAYYFLKMKPYITASGYDIYWTLLRRCRYYSMELFFFFSTCYIQVMSTRQLLRQMSPSPMFVYIQGHALHQSTYLILLVPFV